jgi:crossover junction endodeoxyribonuclease RuvC
MKDDEGFHVLGIDPGTRYVGWGLIHVSRGVFRAVDYGYFEVDKDTEFSDKLYRIYTFIFELLSQWCPDVVAVEEVYVSQNAKTTLRLGHTRGVILLAAVQRGIRIFEYAPREVKQAVFGCGSATKDQIQWMLVRLLALPKEKIQEDAADGLAVALCHSLRCSNSTVHI